MRILIALLLSLIAAQAQTNELKIVNHLMDLPKVSRSRGTNTIDTIVLHFSSDVVAHPHNPYNVDTNIAIYAAATASAHYLIDREGTVYRLVPEERAAYHAGKGQLPWPPYRSNLNNTSIGIEMLEISTWADMKKFGFSKSIYDQVAKPDIGFTEAQYKSLNLLLASIRQRWPAIPFDRHHIIGHSDYAPTRRTDPGELFDYTRIGLPATMPAN